MPPETENAQKNLLHPKRLSIHRLLFGHFHWRCLFCSLLIAICALHVGYCQIYGPISQSHSLNHSPGPCSHGYNLIPMALGALIYLVYLSECWHYRTHICSLPRMGANQIVEFASAMRNAVPVVWWKSVSYHYLRRTRQVARYRNGDVITRSQVYYERVNSHQSGNVFLYDQSGYKDISKELAGLNQFSMVRIRLSKGFVFACLQAANEFEEQRTRFFNENEMLDDYMEVHEGFDLANLPFIERALIFPERKAGENQKWRKFLHWILRRPMPPPAHFSASRPTLLLPWWFSTWAFWPASLILLSWPIRMIAEFRAGNLHFQITKLFGTNYLSPSSVNYTGPLTRTSTMDSRELELANRQNYLIVPSYSEAILLDPYQNEASAQSNNFFRQIFSSPRRNPIQPPVSHYAPSVDYGSFRGPKDAQKGPRNGPPIRSHSIGCFIDQNNMENGLQNQNGHRHHQRHLPRPSTLMNSQRRNQSRRQPPRSITFCEGIINNGAQQREDEAEESSDRMPLLTATNRRQGQFIDDNHQMPSIPCAIFHQLTEHPTEIPNEPPPPYEIALRYCSPIYQRLRQSVHSISSMFSRSASGRDLRQIYVNDGMQGPSPSNY